MLHLENLLMWPFLILIFQTIRSINYGKTIFLGTHPFPSPSPPQTMLEKWMKLIFNIVLGGRGVQNGSFPEFPNIFAPDCLNFKKNNEKAIPSSSISEIIFLCFRSLFTSYMTAYNYFWCILSFGAIMADTKCQNRIFTVQHV